jgi:hypothetical protein
MSKFDWFSQPLFGNKAWWKWLKVLSMKIDIFNETCDLFMNEKKFQLRREVQIKCLNQKKEGNLVIK